MGACTLWARRDVRSGIKSQCGIFDHEEGRLTPIPLLIVDLSCAAEASPARVYVDTIITSGYDREVNLSEGKADPAADSIPCTP